MRRRTGAAGVAPTARACRPIAPRPPGRTVDARIPEPPVRRVRPQGSRVGSSSASNAAAARSHHRAARRNVRAPPDIVAGARRARPPARSRGRASADRRPWARPGTVREVDERGSRVRDVMLATRGRRRSGSCRAGHGQGGRGFGGDGVARTRSETARSRARGARLIDRRALQQIRRAGASTMPHPASVSGRRGGLLDNRPGERQPAHPAAAARKRRGARVDAALEHGQRAEPRAVEVVGWGMVEPGRAHS